MPIYEVLPDPESPTSFVVQVGNRPTLRDKITICVDEHILCFLTRTMISRKKEKSCIYDWCVNGSLTSSPYLISSPYDSEKEALNAVLHAGYKVYVFDTLQELAKFIINREK
jgi:hypothetical protein